MPHKSPADMTVDEFVAWVLSDLRGSRISAQHQVPESDDAFCGEISPKIVPEVMPTAL